MEKDQKNQKQSEEQETSLSVDQFVEQYDPELDEDGKIKQYETYGEDMKHIRHQKDENVWTALDGEGNAIIYSNGYWHINRLYYIVTKKPWTGSRGMINVTDE